MEEEGAGVGAEMVEAGRAGEGEQVQREHAEEGD